MIEAKIIFSIVVFMGFLLLAALALTALLAAAAEKRLQTPTRLLLGMAGTAVICLLIWLITYLAKYGCPY